jgi:hypothetical protein
MAALAAQTQALLTARQEQQAPARVRGLAAAGAQQARQEQARPRAQETAAQAERRAAAVAAGRQDSIPQQMAAPAVAAHAAKYGSSPMSKTRRLPARILASRFDCGRLRKVGGLDNGYEYQSDYILLGLPADHVA